MKKSILVICIVVLLLIVGGVVYAGIGGTYFDMGRYYSDAVTQTEDSDVAAEYKEYKIYRASVDYVRKMNAAAGAKENSNLSDKDIVNGIIENIIIMEEAQRLGLAATDEEVEAMINSVKSSYDIPDGKEMIDSYCAGAGITVEQYFDIVSEQIPRTIARQKLKDDLGQKYCIEHGIEFTKINPSEKMLKAVDDDIREIFEKNSKYIVYYVN